MLPLSVDVSMKRLPWANWGLILVTVLAGLDTSGSLYLHKRHFAPHQLITHLFQHADGWHLFGNMLFLFVFGNPVNAKLGHVRFLLAYVGIGVFVGLCWLGVGRGEACLGASGAVMGGCGVFLVLYPRNDVKLFWTELDIAVLTRSFTGEVPGWVIVGLFFAFDLWGTIFRHESRIAYVSHVIGALAGFGLAIWLLKTGRLKADRDEQTLLTWLRLDDPPEDERRRRR